MPAQGALHNAATAMLSIRFASQATTTLRSQVWRAPGRAQGTFSVRTLPQPEDEIWAMSASNGTARPRSSSAATAAGSSVAGLGFDACGGSFERSNKCASRLHSSVLTVDGTAGPSIHRRRTGPASIVESDIRARLEAHPAVDTSVSRRLTAPEHDLSGLRKTRAKHPRSQYLR